SAASVTATLTLTLHYALPIYHARAIGTRGGETIPFGANSCARRGRPTGSHRESAPDVQPRHHRSEFRSAHKATGKGKHPFQAQRSEEHTSELQSRENLVCRLL